MDNKSEKLKNLPNILTVVRICSVPFFVFFLLMGMRELIYGDPFPNRYVCLWIALGIFVIASVTDWLDGYIARKHSLITDFGKFMDPLADKILTVSALLCFVDIGVIRSVPVIIIIAREFAVSGMRLVTADKGVVAPADKLGKIKTAVTMITVIFMLCGEIFLAGRYVN
ncbi:MAG: CDP-diacylglycerol--glycerol-3-phosphate 3-phosphatidyltransferase, partial [Oscillospiraceae bacterium]|nr:CDP-diacylglycerol--glycerol-3-phosphate 3-phosphatidyltransferase [Oscillospiraceae bacterium]